jgi:ribosome-associated protein
LVVKGASNLEAIEVARQVVEAASNKQAQDIILLDIRKVCSFADYFVICTAESSRQIDAIAEEIREQLKKDDITPYRTQGSTDSGWVLLDLGNVIVHIFSPDQREYYKLDELWQEGIPTIRIQ